MRAPVAGKTFKRGHEESYGPKKTLVDFEVHLKAVNCESTDVTARFVDKNKTVKKNKQRRQAEAILALTTAHLAGREQVSLNALATFLKTQLRPATETFEMILWKTKLKLVGVLRLFPSLEVEHGRYVKLR